MQRLKFFPSSTTTRLHKQYFNLKSYVPKTISDKLVKLYVEKINALDGIDHCGFSYEPLAKSYTIHISGSMTGEELLGLLKNSDAVKESFQAMFNQSENVYFWENASEIGHRVDLVLSHESSDTVKPENAGIVNETISGLYRLATKHGCSVISCSESGDQSILTMSWPDRACFYNFKQDPQSQALLDQAGKCVNLTVKQESMGALPYTSRSLSPAR